eukprot:CAMPEP_0198297536 /NCGR_PEP_ID=MMETSP1449-20131203/37075_1 /TAXON_ID=420275 /ORGANISM="Attheya septentrionalis, Strain CCMP2084" /LENGTH=243 /DNA_ID=CAMNT_0043998485 /DNA_START=380 /DNA_END=1112 /DNA_ORIENTATION=-
MEDKNYPKYVRGKAAVTLSNATMIVTGHENKMVHLRDLEAGASWEDLPAMVTPRHDHAAVLVDDRIVVVMGGWISKEQEGKRFPVTERLTSVEMFDLQGGVGGQWKLIGNMVTARERFAASLVVDHIIVAGGSQTGLTMLESLEHVHAEKLVNGTATSFIPLVSPTVLSQGRVTFGMVSRGDGLLVVGGRVMVPDGRSTRATPSVEKVVFLLIYGQSSLFSPPFRMYIQDGSWFSSVGYHVES